MFEFLQAQDLSCLEIVDGKELESYLLELRKATDVGILEAASQRLRSVDGKLVEAGVHCQVCNKPMTRNRAEGHSFGTAMGSLDLTRAYLECRDCKVRYHPFDVHLRLLKIGQMMPVWANAISHLGAQLPYEPGSQLLKDLTGRSVSASTIDDQVQRDGATLHRLECDEAEKLFPHDAKGRARPVPEDVVRTVRERSVAKPRPPGRILVLQMDGAMINLAADPQVKKERARGGKKRRTKEGKEPSSDEEAKKEGSPFRESMQILIYRQDDVVRKGKGGKGKKERGKDRRERTIIEHKQTACVVNDPAMVVKQVNRLAQLWRSQEYQVRVFISDGAEKHWEIAKAYYDFTVGILDINHARSHIHECGRALYSNDSSKAKAWGKEWSRRVLHEGPKPLLAHLLEMKAQPWSEEGTRRLTNIIEYVQTHQEHMNYPEYVAKGYPIASGAVEGANKNLLVSRCRRAGQQFKRANAQHLLSLRTALIDGRWDWTMEKVREAQACPHEQRIPLGLRPEPDGKEALSQSAGESPGSEGKASDDRASERSSADAKSPIPWRKMVRLIQSGLADQLPGGQGKEVADHRP